MIGRAQLLVLANSVKQGGRCVAGRFIEKNDKGRWQIGAWCRPLCPDGDGHDSLPDASCSHFKPLDVVRLSLRSHHPVDGQPENYLWDNSAAIEVVHTFNNQQNSIKQLVEAPDDIWLDQFAIRPDEVGTHVNITQSLYLIQPQNLRLTLFKQEARKRIHAGFDYHGHRYEGIPATDPVMMRIFSRQFPDDGVKEVTLNHGDQYWLTVSISLPFGPRSARYKFVAAIIDHSGYIQRSYR